MEGNGLVGRFWWKTNTPANECWVDCSGNSSKEDLRRLFEEKHESLQRCEWDNIIAWTPSSQKCVQYTGYFCTLWPSGVSLSPFHSIQCSWSTVMPSHTPIQAGGLKMNNIHQINDLYLSCYAQIKSNWRDPSSTTTSLPQAISTSTLYFIQPHKAACQNSLHLHHECCSLFF